MYQSAAAARHTMVVMPTNRRTVATTTKHGWSTCHGNALKATSDTIEIELLT